MSALVFFRRKSPFGVEKALSWVSTFRPVRFAP